MTGSTFDSAIDLAAAIRSGERSPVDVLETHLDRIDERGDRTNAFVTLLADEARERAREAEAAIERGEDFGPLGGVPVAIKDLSDSKAGVRHTYGMAPLAENVADRTTVAVRRLEDAGAIVLGTTNTLSSATPSGRTTNCRARRRRPSIPSVTPEEPPALKIGRASCRERV